MHPIVKILLGAVLMIGSAWTIYRYTLDAFWTIIQGIIPPLVFVLGLFLVWLELDELRIEKEIKTEEKQTKRRAKKE